MITSGDVPRAATCSHRRVANQLNHHHRQDSDFADPARTRHQTKVPGSPAFQ
jgi:hypothetical protein